VLIKNLKFKEISFLGEEEKRKDVKKQEVLQGKDFL